MDGIRHLIWLIPIIPLVGAVTNLLLGKRLGKSVVFTIACGTILASFVLAVTAFFHLLSLPESQRTFTDLWYTWVRVGNFKADAAFLVDPLSSVMILIITGVGFLIHLYSIGYMGDDPSAWRYFGYLNLFVFAMLTLVLADNFFLMFIGWEGVGLCSYLLIGFWYKEKKNTDAGKKAFVVNRIGDWAFIAGVMLLFWELGQRTGVWTVTFVDLKASAFALSGVTIGGVLVMTLVGILLFIGATGKSAQIPLYVWLPDAMAGPTPVSALIHAATMVTAGVYMIGRVHFIYDMSPTALLVVATVGGLTALFAATIGLVQNDIKKVLAYSTVSQLGYMFLAMGVGAYSAGIFHLMTHAFFKACLFLGSGSVILACHHEQDIRKMGGLRKMMPITYLTFLVSTLAIAGIIPFSGFFSKDEILWQAFSSKHGSPFLWFLGVTGAFLTAFYMFRLVYLTFHGTYRGGHDDHGHGQDAHGHDDHGHAAGGHAADAHDHGHGHGGTPKESPRVITFPLQVLALLAALAGFLNVPTALGDLVGWHNSNLFHQWLKPSLTSAAHLNPGAQGLHGETIPMHPAPGETKKADPFGTSPPPLGLSDAVRAARGAEIDVIPGQDSLLPMDRNAPPRRIRPIEGVTTGTGAGETAGIVEAEDEHEVHNPALEFGLMILSLVVAVSGWGLANLFYVKDPSRPQGLKERFAGVYNLLLNKWYVDELYQAVFVNNTYRLSNFLAWFDKTFIDGAVNFVGRFTVLWSWVTGKFDNIVVDGFGVNGLAATIMNFGRGLRQVQTGKIQGYLMIGLLGILAIIVLRIL